MAPSRVLSFIVPQVDNLAVRNATETLFTPSSPVSQYLQSQWHNPSDILSVLLLLGPEIVQSAIAQVAGRTIAPVAFSFGWTAYAFKALLGTIGGR